MAVAVAVMGGAQQPQIVGLGATAERIRHHVIYLQQMPGAAPAPTAPVHVAAAAPVALPHLPPDRRRNSAAAASDLRRRNGDSGGCRGPVRCLSPRRRSRRARRSVRGAAAASYGAAVSAVTSAVRVATAGRFATVTRRWPASAGTFGAEVAEPAGRPVCGAAAASGPAAVFGAEVWRATSAVRRRPRPRGRRDGSWRSSASRTTRPRSCPNVICGSTCDSSPLSCSNPTWQSSSITALSSHRPAPSGRIRSAARASSGSTLASISFTCPRALAGRPAA